MRRNAFRKNRNRQSEKQKNRHTESIEQNISVNTERETARKSIENSENTEHGEKHKDVKIVPVHLTKDLTVDCEVIHWHDGDHLARKMPTGKRFKLKHNGEWHGYEALYCSFDIETTNIDQDDKHLAFMYHWQMIICSNKFGYIYLGRTWAAWLDLMEKLRTAYDLNEDHRIIIWDANAGFEFQFIRKYFTWDPEDFFAREERHPMKFRTGGFEFHEALTISGGSLAQLAKDYTTTQKLVGDLDYKILRNSSTPLTEAEENYCINDVVILAEFSRFIFDNYIFKDHRIPLTKTGILRSDCRLALTELAGAAGAATYRSLIYESFPSPEVYERWFKYLFRGGYVHSNILMTGFVILHVLGFDITSSYPAEMLLKAGYPLTPFVPEPFSRQVLKEKCCIMTCRFRNIKRRWSHSIESKSKAIDLQGSKEMPIVIDNGRIAQAASLTVMLTEIDFALYERYYTWEGEPEILSFETSKRGRLPLFIRKTLIKYYRIKAKLKAEGKTDSPEYVIAKQKVNSFFGMMVTRIELSKITYSNDLDKWKVSEKALDFSEEIKSQFLLPQWGIYVTALGRASLLNMTADITELIGDGRGDNGAGVIYNDTDSIKVYDPDGIAQQAIDRYNENIRRLRRESRLTDPVFDGLGEFDFEEEYDRFKTLGSKRYLTESHGKVKATIAGLPKQAILNCEGDPFNDFDIDGMLLDADVSLKKTISYNDEHTEDIVDGELMQEESSAGIFDISFTMNLDKAYYLIVTQGLTERIQKYGD